jgi:hypothetical protein
LRAAEGAAAEPLVMAGFLRPHAGSSRVELSGRLDVVFL